MKFFNKTFGFLVTAVLVLVITGFGCKGTSKEQQEATRPITIEYWTVFDDVNVLRSLAEEYRKQRPNININIRQIGYDEIYDRFLEALADDKGPDIISVSNRSLGKYISRLQPMPATVKDTLITVISGKFSDTVNVNVQTRNLVNEVQLEKDYVRSVKKDAVRNGKIYGLPLSTDVMAIYYNKDLLDRAGIPEPPKTWEEFQEDVKKLTKFQKSTGKIVQSGTALGTGQNVPNSSDILYLLYTQSKLTFTDSNGAARFHAHSTNQGSPANSVIDFYTDFANSSRDTYSWNDKMPNALESFINGTTAFFFGYNYQYPIIKGRAPQLNFDVIPMLQLTPDAKVNVANYWLQAVTLKSKHPNEAWAFVDYLTHSAATKKYLDQTKKPTALRVYINAQLDKPELNPFVSQVLNAENWYLGKNYDAANGVIQGIFADWIKEPPSADMDEAEWKQSILNRAAAKFNQTL